MSESDGGDTKRESGFADGRPRHNRDSRKSTYKNRGQFRQDELKKKREDQQVEIRKQKREESIAKRRNLQPAPGAAGGAGDSDEDEAVATQLDNQVSSQVSLCLCAIVVCMEVTLTLRCAMVDLARRTAPPDGRGRLFRQC